MTDKKNLFLFTISFPNAEGEPFLTNEFPFLLEAFDTINIITSSDKKNKLSLPEKVKVHSINDILKSKRKGLFALQNLFSILGILLREFRNCSSKAFFLRNLRSYNSTLINSFICADYITRIPEFRKTAVFYSFWMNNHALTLSVLKLKKKISDFVFRVHGYDLVLERWPHKYIAFQATCHHYAKRIFTVSEKSRQYFESTYKNKSKARVAYLGFIERANNPTVGNKDVLRIVSCSNIIPLKRLHLIADILKEVTITVEWLHFGDGYLKNEIMSLCKSLPENITVKFLGRVSQEELFKFYSENRIDFFINVSDDEGLPFTIIEATSFGIPIIATDVGGTSEIVNPLTGLLLPMQFDTKSVSTFLQNESSKKMLSPEFRKGVKEFWEANFSAAKIYPHFINSELKSLDYA